jgi:hypothetical protein
VKYVQGVPNGSNRRIVLRATRPINEILVGEISLALPTFLQTLEETGFSKWMRESDSVFGFYFILLLHTVGLALLVGSNAVVDLRLLGMAREIPLMPLKRFFRVMWLGFAINVTTGVLLLLAYPTKQLTNPDFYIKLTLITLAVWIMHRLKTRVFDDSTLNETAMMARGASLAKWSLVFWAGAITAGRLLAYTYKYVTFP